MEMPVPRNYLNAVQQNHQTVNALFAFLNARLTRAEDGEAVITMPITCVLGQGGGMVAGGIMATLADEAMAHAVLSTLPQGNFAVTAEMNIRYLRSADPKKGGELIASAKVVKQGHSLCVAESGVKDESGRLLATSGATFYVMRAREESSEDASGAGK